MNKEMLCTWLGLEKTAWPPDPWTLLGLPRGEHDLCAIEDRVQDRMTKLRHYQLSYPEEATEGMNRLAEAFVAMYTFEATCTIQIRAQAGGGRIDYRSDIYSAGAMLFEFLTGKTPFVADNALAMMRLHMSAPVPDPRGSNSDLPQGVADMVMRAMAKDPNDRFPSITAFALALSSAVDVRRNSAVGRRSGAVFP